MKNLETFEKFKLNFFKKGKKAIEQIINRNPMTKDDDISSDIPRILTKAYDNKCLYLEAAYGNIGAGIYSGADFSLPYSDGKERTISFYMENDHELNNIDIVRVHDGPRNRFSGETDDSMPYIVCFKYIEDLINTEYDKRRKN